MVEASECGADTVSPIRMDEILSAQYTDVRSRSTQTEERCETAFTILATMMITSAIICCFGMEIPELLLKSAVITMVCSGLGVAGTMLIMADNTMERLSDI